VKSLLGATMGPDLSVIYENPRFDANTPTLWPVIDRAFRFGAVLGLEWGSLTLVEEAPRYLKVATIVIAVLILAVLESWPWLRMRDKRLFPVLMATLIVGYAGVFGYAFITKPTKPHAVASVATSHVPSAPARTPISEAKAAPFISPIHEKSQKWDFVMGIRAWMRKNGSSADYCQVNIVYNSLVRFAEVSATDFKEILTVVGWRYDESPLTDGVRAELNVEPDITVRTIYSTSGPSRDCAEALVLQLKNVGKRRDGSAISAPERRLAEAEASDYLKRCGPGCVEVRFGDESK